MARTRRGDDQLRRFGMQAHHEVLFGAPGIDAEAGVHQGAGGRGDVAPDQAMQMLGLVSGDLGPGSVGGDEIPAREAAFTPVPQTLGRP